MGQFFSIFGALLSTKEGKMAIGKVAGGTVVAAAAGLIAMSGKSEIKKIVEKAAEATIEAAHMV